MNVIDRLSSNVHQKWRLPGDQDRVSIVGKTGSGKTTAGLFLLNEMNSFEKMPWIIVDYKRDDLIEQIPACLLRVGGDPPKDPGIYKLECSPFLSHDDYWRVNSRSPRRWRW